MTIQTARIMNIEISNSKSISELQARFNEAFPYLKIEFFSKPHDKGKATSNKFLVDRSSKLGEFAAIKDRAELSIVPQMRVSELEKTFAENFGLFVQVFRKSGKIWLETTATDDWTLEKQNEEGREFSTASKETGEISDYHEQE